MRFVDEGRQIVPGFLHQFAQATLCSLVDEVEPLRDCELKRPKLSIRVA